MKTFLAIVGMINVIILLLILSPLGLIAYVVCAPVILLFVILYAIIKRISKPKRKEEHNKC